MAVMHSKMMSIVRGSGGAYSKSESYETSTRASESTGYPDSEDEWSKSDLASTQGEVETCKPRSASSFTDVSSGEVSLGDWWQQEEEEQEGLRKMTSTLTEYDMSGLATVKKLRRRSLGDWWLEDEKTALHFRATTGPSEVLMADSSDVPQPEVEAVPLAAASDVQETRQDVLMAEWQKVAEQQLLERQSMLYYTEFWNQITSMVFCSQSS